MHFGKFKGMKQKTEIDLSVKEECGYLRDVL